MKPIYITGDIDIASFTKFSKTLARYEALGQTTVNVVLISDGGEATTALAFCDRIRLSKANINITAIGQIASAAVMILAAGDIRRMSPSSWVMVHEDQVVNVEDKQVHEVEKIVAHGRRMELQWCNILAHLTAASREKWLELHRRETFLNPQECLELGLIDEILDGNIAD